MIVFFLVYFTKSCGENPRSRPALYICLKYDHTRRIMPLLLPISVGTQLIRWRTTRKNDCATPSLSFQPSLASPLQLIALHRPLCQSYTDHSVSLSSLQWAPDRQTFLCPKTCPPISSWTRPCVCLFYSSNYQLCVHLPAFIPLTVYLPNDSVNRPSIAEHSFLLQEYSESHSAHYSPDCSLVHPLIVYRLLLATTEPFIRPLKRSIL